MRKKLLIINLFILCILGALGKIMVVEAAKNPYKENSRWGVNCTWYAWDQAKRKAGVELPGWGNANTWYDYAKKAGFEVGRKPKAKSIGVWKWDKYGHVGYVERVSDTGDKIYIWHSDGTCLDTNDPKYLECMKNSVSAETDQACREKYAKPIACEYSADFLSEPGDLIGYIYLDSAPKKTTTKKVTTKISTSTTNPSTKVKANNANLASITVNGTNISLNKDNLEYFMEVENEIDKVLVEAKAEDKLATIAGLGSHDLNIGENVIKLSVVAEDGTKKDYTLKVMRKDKEVIPETTARETEKIEENKKDTINNNYYIYIAILFIIILVIIVMTVVKKKRH